MLRLVQTNHEPTEAMLMRINPVEDRITEAIEVMSKLKRMCRRPPNTQAWNVCANFLHKEVEDVLDKVSNAIDEAIEKG